jgi:hypothetical protein
MLFKARRQAWLREQGARLRVPRVIRGAIK